MSQQNEIKDLAYRLWDEAGRPEGQDMEFWLQAEASLAKPAPAAKSKVAAKPKAPAKPKAAATPKAPAKAKKSK